MSNLKSEVKGEVVRGSLDYEFGMLGKVYLYDDVSGRLPLLPRVVHLMDDGRILCAAVSQSGETICLVMLDEFGVVDESFGKAGISRINVTDFFPEVSEPVPYDIKVDAARQKIIVGFGAIGPGSWRVTGLARFELNGDPDSGFGRVGVIVYDFLESSIASESNSSSCAGSHQGASQEPDSVGLSRYPGGMLLQEDGSVMLLFSLGLEGFFQGVLLAKIGINGRLDRSFSTAGFKIFDRDGLKRLRAETIVPQGDNFLIALTTSASEEGGWYVARYDKDGELDTTFALGGYYDGQPGVKRTVLIGESLSEIYVVGTSANAATQHLFLMLQRRGGDGQLDPLFGEQGWGDAVDAGSPGTPDLVVWKAELYEPKSTVVVAGTVAYSSSGINKGFILSLEQDMGWDIGFGDQGKVLFDGKGDIYGLAVQPDRKILFIYDVDDSSVSALVRLHG